MPVEPSVTLGVTVATPSFLGLSTLGTSASAVGTSVVLVPGVAGVDEAGGRSVSECPVATVALSVGPVGAAVSSADTPLLTKPVATRAVKKAPDFRIIERLFLSMNKQFPFLKNYN